MPKALTSVRINPDVRDRLQRHNTMRSRCGFKPVSLGEVLEDCVDLWIAQDKDKLKRYAADIIAQVDS